MADSENVTTVTWNVPVQGQWIKLKKLSCWHHTLVVEMEQANGSYNLHCIKYKFFQYDWPFIGLAKIDFNLV
jgi:hypothetical protein